MALCSKAAGTIERQHYKNVSKAMTVLPPKTLSLYESAKAANMACSLAQNKLY